MKFASTKGLLVGLVLGIGLGAVATSDALDIDLSADIFNIGAGALTATGTITGPSGTWDAGGIDIATTDTYAIAGTNVIDNATTLTSTMVTSSLTTVGILASGSISANFGNIDNGSSTISSTGTMTGPSGTWDSGGIDIATTDTYAIAGTNVIDNATTFTSTMVTSSLTTVGNLNAGSITSGFTSIDVGAGAILTTGTLGAGVTTFSGLVLELVTDTITAGTTQTQAGATVLTSQYNRVTISAGDDDGVALPPAATGLVITIINDDAAQDIQIWPAASQSDTIDGGAADAVDPANLGEGLSRTYFAVDATAWFTQNVDG